VDEAQDQPMVVVGILRAYRDAWGIVLLGDSQQGINGWMGACNGMRALWSLYTPEQRREFVLSYSFRFSLDVADRLLNKMFADVHPLTTPIRSAATHTTRIVSLATEQEAHERKCWDARLAGTNTEAAPTPWSLASHVLDTCRGMGSADTCAIVSRTQLELVELVEQLGQANSDATRAPVSFYCCPSVLAAMHELLRKARLPTDDACDTHKRYAFVRGDDDEDAASDESLRTFLRCRPNQAAFVARLQEALCHCVTDATQAHLHLYTTHSCKGLEWTHVYLTDDLSACLAALEAHAKKAAVTEADKETLDHLSLLYVAMSRVRRTLYLPASLHRLASATSLRTMVAASA
jgi:hypothetical protein